MAERPEDLNLPNSVVTRIIKDALPEGVNVSKDARLAISKAASVFVLYATSCANTIAMQNKRKTISGTDVIEAVDEMEFERFADPLKSCLKAFKKEQQGKKEAAEKKKKDKQQEAEEAQKDEEPAADVAMETAAPEEDDDVVEIDDDEEEVEEEEEEAEAD